MEIFAPGPLHLGSVIVWTVIALLLAAAGGAVMGMKLAGKDLGNALAAMLGAMFGPAGAVPGILLALIILALTGGTP